MSSPLPEGYEIVESNENELNKPSEEAVDPFFTQRDHKIMNEVSINRLNSVYRNSQTFHLKADGKFFAHHHAEFVQNEQDDQDNESVKSNRSINVDNDINAGSKAPPPPPLG